jgi:hypothetical protein
MRSELTALFQRLADELPPGAVCVETRATPDNRSTVIELKPANPAAADFGVLCDDLDVYSVGFGFHDWEFPYERRYRKGEKNVLAEIEEMARAVIAGQCEEVRGWFSTTGKIDVGDYTYRVTDMPKFFIRPFGTHRFAPYMQSSV